MSPEAVVIQEAVERCKTNDFCVERFTYNISGTIQLPSAEELWRESVMALLTSQQRATANSAVETFLRSNPFPLALQTYKELRDADVDAILGRFRFHKKITLQLRRNHGWLFCEGQGWTLIEPKLNELLQQRNSPPDLSHKNLERTVAQLLADKLKGIGPKQSRNLLQSIGLTRYEIPLDSRVVGWLRENLEWNICKESLSNSDSYEELLDRVQAACQSAGVLPAAFDAAAFVLWKPKKSSEHPTTCIGYINRNGQLVIRNTRLNGTDRNQYIYQLACSHCGHVYGANGSDIHLRLCPKCQGGASGLPYG